MPPAYVCWGFGRVVGSVLRLARASYFRQEKAHQRKLAWAALPLESLCLKCSWKRGGGVELKGGHMTSSWVSLSHQRMPQQWMWIAKMLPFLKNDEEQEASQEAQPAVEASGATGSSGTPGLSPSTLLGAEVASGLLAIEDAKPDEHYQASDQIRGTLDHLGEQLQQNMELQLAERPHTTDDYPENVWLSCEYASKACQRTGARLNMDGQEFNLLMQHPNETMKVALNGLMPYLDDYIMNVHDPFVEDFVWSMDDESVSKELTEIDVPKLLLFADRDVIQAVRTSSTSAAAEVAGRDPTKAV